MDEGVEEEDGSMHAFLHKHALTISHACMHACSLACMQSYEWCVDLWDEKREEWKARSRTEPEKVLDLHLHAAHARKHSRHDSSVEWSPSPLFAVREVGWWEVEEDGGRTGRRTGRGGRQGVGEEGGEAGRQQEPARRPCD